MITFEEAAAKVGDEFGPSWSGPGLFYVAPWGWDDGVSFYVLVGAHEAIVGGDPSFSEINDIQTIVDKLTGVVGTANAMDTLTKRLVPVGDWSQAPTDDD